MNHLILRSIPLSRETSDAWRNANCSFVKRSHTSSTDINKSIRRLADARSLINLGFLGSNLTNISVPVFNRPDTIRSISHPLALRRTLNDYIPEKSIKGPHWHKNGGFGGKGKTFHETECGGNVPGDVQSHVEGTEYRVITVGDTVVQAHRKELLDGIGNFNWVWCGVDGIRKNGLIPLVKEAGGKIPAGDFTIFGWDCIVAEQPYIIEINTSPGVNESTAKRIIAQVERMI